MILTSELLDKYVSRNPSEENTISTLQALIKVRSNRAYFRDEYTQSELYLPGHITSSLLVTNPERTHFLLMKHKSLGKLLQF